MKRILFVLENLGNGGAERVFPNLLNFLDSSKYDVTVLTLFSDGANRQRLPDNVRYFCRKAFRFPGITYAVKFLPAKWLYRYYIKRQLPQDDFDVAIAYMHGLPTKVVAGSPCKRVTWLHGNMLGGYTPPLRRVFLTFAGMRSCLQNLDAVVGVSQVICESFQKYTGIDQAPRLIHNTLDIEEIQKQAEQPSPYGKPDGRLELVTVGHLQTVKGNDRLLEAVQRLQNEGFAFHLTILGEGPQRKNLENYLRENNLEKLVSLPGHIANPYPYIKNADVYVCPSRSEGFSTAVSEAIILGLPVVSTRVSGAAEILGEQNEYGLICENSTEGIYAGLKQLLASPERRQHYARQALQRAVIFNPAQTVGDVERLLDELLTHKDA